MLTISTRVWKRHVQYCCCSLVVCKSFMPATTQKEKKNKQNHIRLQPKQPQRTQQLLNITRIVKCSNETEHFTQQQKIIKGEKRQSKRQMTVTLKKAHIQREKKWLMDCLLNCQLNIIYIIALGVDLNIRSHSFCGVNVLCSVLYVPYIAVFILK